MVDKNKLIQSAMTAFLVLAVIPSIEAATSKDSATLNTEKCYGVVKAGLNDCATATSSCAGSSTKNAQADAFIFVPQGLCEKLVGGSLTAGDKKS